MNKCIVTRADLNIKDMSDITHPLLKRYAKKCKADFKVLEDSKELHPHYRILQIYPLFKDYDRIAVIDTDVLVLKDCPSIFDEVPEDKIGAIFEDKGSRLVDRRQRIRSVQEKFTNVGWKTGYINTGVSVFSRYHKAIFKYSKGQALWDDLGFDDVYLGYMLNFMKYEVYELDYTWCFMSMFSESWFNASRYDAKMIHYAGGGFDRRIPRLNQIKQDYLLLKKYGKLI